MLHFQDPTDADAPFLHEALLDSARQSAGGGGAFAWATVGGVRLLLMNPDFVGFVSRSGFDLVVGVHSVTTVSALRLLAQVASDVKGLNVSVFMPERQLGLFHPKVAWFQSEGGGTLIIGSGNLTFGGLRGNWEAYSQSQLDAAGYAEINEKWVGWLSRHRESLFAPDDPRVLERASKNESWTRGRSRRVSRKRVGGLAPEAGTGDGAPASVADTQALQELHVLIYEIPNGNRRWKQANFVKQVYEDFFGAIEGRQLWMVFQHVDQNQQLGLVESRPSVEVASQNYRFELDAASGLPYPDPDEGRPIGVFLRVRQRTFLYRLYMPGDRDHPVLDQYLADAWRGRADRMRWSDVPVSSVDQLSAVQDLVRKVDEAFPEDT